jgi:hypothetical protein
MPGWVDVKRVGCSSLAAHMSDIHPSKIHFFPSQPITDTFHPGYQSSNKPSLCQNLKTNYTLVPYGDHGTDGVKIIKYIYEPLQLCFHTPITLKMRSNTNHKFIGIV